MKDPAWTPCIGKCTPDTPDGSCRGCGRTAEEIRDWNTYSRERKIEINERLKNLNKSVGARK